MGPPRALSQVFKAIQGGDHAQLGGPTSTGNRRSTSADTGIVPQSNGKFNNLHRAETKCFIVVIIVAIGVLEAGAPRRTGHPLPSFRGRAMVGGSVDRLLLLLLVQYLGGCSGSDTHFGFFYLNFVVLQKCWCCEYECLGSRGLTSSRDESNEEQFVGGRTCCRQGCQWNSIPIVGQNK